MMRLIDGHEIVNLKRGGSTDKGEKIYFQLELKGNLAVTLLCPHQRLDSFMTMLQTFAGMAAEDRAKNYAKGSEKN